GRRARQHRGRPHVLVREHAEQLTEAVEPLLEEIDDRLVGPVARREAGPAVQDDGVDLGLAEHLLHVRAYARGIVGKDAVAREAERAGFAWVSCSDHVAVPTSRAAAMGAVWYDAGSTLAFVAGATTRIELLSHVLVLPYRHPLVVAKQYGTLDRLSGGRVILGVGSGHLKPEFAALGADYDQRGRVTDEYIHAIGAAWEADVARFDGQTVAFRDVMVAPRPIQQPRPPIWVGGNSRAAVRRAARHAHGWIPWQLAPDDFAAAVAFARPDGTPLYTNRLALESSPYLRQHAHNPVDWHPWGDEAFETARRLERPVLLSVGYSTCHWCHVMEEESFEDEEIARYLNEHYVA